MIIYRNCGFVNNKHEEMHTVSNKPHRTASGIMILSDLSKTIHHTFSMRLYPFPIPRYQ